MCEEGSTIAFESQEGLQGEERRSSKGVLRYQSHSNSFKVIQRHRIQVLLRAAEQKQCCRRRGLQLAL